MTTAPTEREQLITLIHDNEVPRGGLYRTDPRVTADAIIAAGYKKPRTVTEYGIVFNRNACSLTPPALSLEEFKERYPRETGWMIHDNDVYITRTIQVVDPAPTAWAVHDGGAA